MRLLLVVAFVAAVAQPVVAQPTWRLVEDLRIGGEPSGPANLVEVRGLAVPKNGNIFVFESRSNEVRLFDASGSFLKLAGRTGAGPGEVRRGLGLAIGDNDVVWAMDRSNARYNLYRPDGSYYKQIPIMVSSYGWSWGAAVDPSGRLIDPSQSMMAPGKGGDVRTRYIRRVDESGRIDTLTYPECASRLPRPSSETMAFENATGNTVMGVPFLARTKVVFTRGGTVWCTPANEYLVLTGEVGSAVKPVVDRKATLIEVTAADKAPALRQIDSLTRFYGRMTRGDLSMIPKHHPAIADLFADDQSRAWVRQSSSGPKSLAFDIFDRTGRQIARATGTGTVDPNFTFITATHLYTVARDEDDIVYVVRYRIQR